MLSESFWKKTIKKNGWLAIHPSNIQAYDSETQMWIIEKMTPEPLVIVGYAKMRENGWFRIYLEEQ